MSPGRRLVGMPLLLLAAAVAGACQSDIDGEQLEAAAGNVLTLRKGTMSQLRRTRGLGPFRRYEVPRDEMVEVVYEAAGLARTDEGRRVSAVFKSKLRGEVVAKERDGADACKKTYNAPFVSAVLVVVHAIPEEPAACRLEIHEIQSGPFHRGSINWCRCLPGLIRRVLDRRAAETAAALAAAAAEAGVADEAEVELEPEPESGPEPSPVRASDPEPEPEPEPAPEPGETPDR